MAEQENLLAATLQQTISAGSTFTLELPGWGFSSYQEGDEYIITHKGEQIFHGYLDAVTQRNEDGNETTAITILDPVARLGKITSMLQEEEVKIEDPMQPSDGISRSTSIAVSVGYALSGRVISVQGIPYTLSVAPAVANYSYVKRTNRTYSMLALLQSVRNAHPDLSVTLDEPSRRIIIDSTRRAAPLELNTEQHALTIDTVEPDFASVCHGVIVTVPQGTEGDLDRIVYRLPSGVSIHEPGIKIIRTAPAVLSHAVSQAFQYYDIASKLFHSCSVTLPLEQAESDYLGKNLALTGPGTNTEWQGMRAPVSAVRWDFIARRVTIESSNAIAEPDIPDDASTPSDSDFPFPSPDPSQSESESESESESMSGGFIVSFLEPTAFEPIPQRQAFMLTLNWTSNLPATFTLLVDDGKMPWLYNMRDLTDMRLELPYGAYTFTVTATTKSTPQQVAMDTSSYAYHGPLPPSPSQPSQSAASSGQPSPPPQPSPSSPSQSCSSPCSELIALKARVTSLEARVKWLEENSCDCNTIMERISAAIDDALNHVQVEVQVDGTLEHNEVGKLKFNTSGTY